MFVYHQPFYRFMFLAPLLANRNVDPVMNVASANKTCPVKSSPYHTQRVVEAVKTVVHRILRNVISWKRCAGGRFRSGLFLEFIIELYHCNITPSSNTEEYGYLFKLDHPGKSIISPSKLR